MVRWGSRKDRRPNKPRTNVVGAFSLMSRAEILSASIFERISDRVAQKSVSLPLSSLLSRRMFNQRGKGIEMAEDGNRVPKTGISIGTKLKNAECLRR